MGAETPREAGQAEMTYAFNDHPPSLIRLVETREYAKQFVDQGCVRLGSLVSYKQTEDVSRNDPTEGQSKYVECKTGVTVGLQCK